jgi:hypothetical protein
LLSQLKPLGPIATAQQIIARETPLGLYKGLGAVVSGIVPKMAIRFASFEGEFEPDFGIVFDALRTVAYALPQLFSLQTGLSR